MADIQTYDEIESLISAFYTKLLNDPVTSVKFSHLNLEEHIPKIASFWAFILLDQPGYKGNVFDRHAHLGLEPIHFEIWLRYWTETISSRYEGPKADLAIQRATLLSYTFQSKMFGDSNNLL